MSDLGWLSEYSESALRSALRVAGAGLDRLPIELTGTNDLSRRTWAMGGATIGGQFLAKFAFSEPTASRVWHEARVLDLLGGQPGFAVPELVAAIPNPAFLATRIIGGGVPLSYELVRDSVTERIDALGVELARFLANLHAPQIVTLARARLDEPLRVPEPGLQATTDELRTRFTPMIDSHQRARVHRWCDWVDEQLAAPHGARVRPWRHPTTSSGTHASFACCSWPILRRAALPSPNTTSVPFPASALVSSSSPQSSTSMRR
jgi:hypothetical protein